MEPRAGVRRLQRGGRPAHQQRGRRAELRRVRPHSRGHLHRLRYERGRDAKAARTRRLPREQGDAAMDLGLKGKMALVTGVSEGIGMAIARKRAEEGVSVAICARTEAKLKETAAEIARGTGMEIVPIPADLRSLAGCQGFVEQAAKRLGGVDILVNNAGASAFGAFVDVPDDAFVDAVCFLVSEGAPYVNGAALVVDGSKSLVI